MRSVQHDSRVVILNTLFCHSERLRGIHLWMLRFAQHDSRVVIPNTLFCHSECLRGIHLWMLRFAQHDKLVDASLRNASFSMAVHLQDIKA